MTKQDCDRNVFLYRLHVLFNEPIFWGPILIASLQKLGRMSLPDIYYCESIVLMICLTLDIPSGALADVIGRKKTIIIGRFFLLGSILFFATMTNPLEAWLGNIFWAIGFSMQSGADNALFYDTLREQGRENEHKRIEGRLVGNRFLLIAICSLATGFLARINLRLPLFLCIPFVLIPLTAGFFLKEPTRTEHYSAKKQFSVIRDSALFMRDSVRARWMVAFAALLATTGKVWFFTYNPYFEVVKLGFAEYGLIFFALNIVAYLSSLHAHKIEQRIGEKNCVIGLVLCLGIPIILMGLVPIQPFAYLVLVQNVVRGFMRPFTVDYMNRHATSRIRATVLSVQSSMANLTSIVSLAMFGWLTGHSTLLHSLVTLGVMSLSLGWVSYRTYRDKIA